MGRGKQLTHYYRREGENTKAHHLGFGREEVRKFSSDGLYFPMKPEKSSHKNEDKGGEHWQFKEGREGKKWYHFKKVHH